MAEKTIEKIAFKNFKAFRSQQAIDFKNKHILIYGNNGSGKSSIFWGLYTFLQSSIKSEAGIQKYFKPFDQYEEETYQSLRNVFEPDEADSFIDLTVKSGSSRTTKRISHDDHEVKDDEEIKLLNATSDFINYKLLSGFYRDSHKYDVNLWLVFERDIFPFLTDNVEEEDYLKKIQRITSDVPRSNGGHPVRNTSRAKNNYIAELNELNALIEGKLIDIQRFANDILKDHFFDGDEKVKVKLTFEKKFHFDLVKQRIWNDGNKPLREGRLKIKLVVQQKDSSTDEFIDIHRVQSFLNEAQLTRIAIAIRIGALRTRIQDSECKILVLDDMLISLDMSNRIEVIKMILNKNNKSSLRFFDKFQKVILTHDLGFYNIIKNYTNSNDWQYYKLRKKENSNDAPKLSIDRSHIQKAQKFLADGEFDSCGNELRKELEATLKNYLDPDLTNDFKTLTERLESAYRKYTQNERLRFEKIFVKKEIPIEHLEKLRTDYASDEALNEDDVKQLDIIKNELFNFTINQYQVQNEKDKLIEDLKNILGRILNPSSHSSTTPLYEQELESAINSIIELRSLLLGDN